MRLIIEHKADPNTPGYNAYRALHCAKSSKSAEMLLDAKAEIDAVSEYGSTPLAHCTAFGCVEVVRVLLERGANVAIKDKAGKTALDTEGISTASQAAFDQCKELIRAHMAKPPITAEDV